MKADDKLQILKFFFLLVNAFFVILGVSIFACSAWILFDKESFVSVLSSEEEVKVVAGGLFVIGLVVLCVSLLGCAGAYFESRCSIVIYLSFLIIIILSQLFVTGVLLIRRKTIEQFLRDAVDNIIRQYGGNETHTSWNLLDSVQFSGRCCGRLASDEWRNNTVIASLRETDIFPCSCFNGTCPVILEGAYSFGKGSNTFEKGCEKVLGDWLEMNIIVIFGMDVGLLFIQILQFIFAVHMYKGITRKTKKLDPDNLLNALEENPSTDLDHTQNSQLDNQTDLPHSDSGCDALSGGYDGGNIDQFTNPVFYKNDHSKEYDGSEYRPGNNSSFQAPYIPDQNYKQDFRSDDY